MGTLMKRDQDQEKRKRYLFLGTTIAGVAAGVGLSWILGAPLLIAGGIIGVDWFRFRAKRGMRF